MSLPKSLGTEKGCLLCRHTLKQLESVSQQSEQVSLLASDNRELNKKMTLLSHELKEVRRPSSCQLLPPW